MSRKRQRSCDSFKKAEAVSFFIRTSDKFFGSCLISKRPVVNFSVMQFAIPDLRIEQNKNSPSELQETEMKRE